MHAINYSYAVWSNRIDPILPALSGLCALGSISWIRTLSSPQGIALLAAAQALSAFALGPVTNRAGRLALFVLTNFGTFYISPRFPLRYNIRLTARMTLALTAGAVLLKVLSFAYYHLVQRRGRITLPTTSKGMQEMPLPLLQRWVDDDERDSIPSGNEVITVVNHLRSEEMSLEKFPQPIIKRYAEAEVDLEKIPTEEVLKIAQLDNGSARKLSGLYFLEGKPIPKNWEFSMDLTVLEKMDEDTPTQNQKTWVERALKSEEACFNYKAQQVFEERFRDEFSLEPFEAKTLGNILLRARKLGRKKYPKEFGARFIPSNA